MTEVIAFVAGLVVAGIVQQARLARLSAALDKALDKLEAAYEQASELMAQLEAAGVPYRPWWRPPGY